MEQHPIPQNISSYQFRLVGDMTLKQFFEVGAGALISIIIYSLPIYPLIKWPLILFFSLFGTALAFLPFQERPLEQWIIAFFRSIYSPTVFRWKSNVPENYFKPETLAMPTSTVHEEKPATVQGSTSPFVGALEETEGKFLSKIASLFNSSNVPAVAPVINVPLRSDPIPAPMTNPGNAILTSPLSAAGMSQVPISTQELPENAPQLPEKHELGIPQMGNISIPKMVVEESIPVPVPSAPITAMPVSQTITGQGASASTEAQFSPDAAPPSPPTITNTVSGQVMDPEGKIIEGAILEIRDGEGRPVRALRSNKVGHFLTVTPLLNGKYELIAEKDDYIFEPLVLTVTGVIVPPIAIRARGRKVSTQVLN